MEKKTVVVTGAGRGMGLEVVRKHSERGDNVYAIAHSITEELKALAAACNNIIIHVCELSSDEQVASTISKIEDKIDILYNVAGIYSFDQNCGISGTDMEDCIKMYDVNALASLRVMKEAKDKLSDTAIVMNVSSEAGSIGQAGRSGEYGYCMSKAALNMGSKLFANEVKDTGIRVFCYHPGWLRTQMGGEGAAKSEFSISAEEAAICVMKVTDKGEIKEGNIEYLDYKGNVLPW